MGKKKGRKAATAVEPPAEESSRLPDEVVEILVALLDVCGVFASEDEDPNSRLTLVWSLGVLGSLLAQNETLDSSSDENFGSWLLKTEATVSTVRHDAKDFMQSLGDERSDVLFLCQDLEDIARDNTDLVSVTHFIQSIAAIYRLHVQAEEERVGSLLQSLDSFYASVVVSDGSPNDIESKRKQIREVSRYLVRKDLSQRLEFQEAISIVSLPPGTEGVRSRSDKKSGVTAFKQCQSLVDMPKQDPGPSRRLLQAKTIYNALDAFLDTDEQDAEPAVTFLLLVGPEGCGKTHVCNEIERLAGDRALVLRPQLPIDIMGSAVGESEDALVSLFMAVIDSVEPVILVLDDLEHALEHQSGSSITTADAPEMHFKTRSQSTFLSMMDSIQRSATKGTRALVVCTVRNDVSDAIGRFDRTFHFETPTEHERRRAILSHLGVGNESDNPALESILTNLAESTVGRSHAEIAQYCRQAIGNVAREETSHDDALTILGALKDQLQNAAPESLRNGIMDDFVDMRVMTARDLGASSERTRDLRCYTPALFGSSIDAAWKELQASIVIPLCQSGELHALLNQSGGAVQKVVTSGLLLTGAPGTGKSEIAYHCARYAASLLPSLKLLDVSCTSLIHKEVGGSERAVHHLFQCARKAAPCILLMDGIENIAAVRGNDPTVEGTLDRVLSTLLVELDGIDDDHSPSAQSGGVAVIGITHNVDWIDAALKRPGRLEKCVTLDYPNDAARLLIVSNSLVTELGTNMDVVEEIAYETRGMAAASIVAVCDDLRMLLASEMELSLSNVQACIQRRRSSNNT